MSETQELAVAIIDADARPIVKINCAPGVDPKECVRQWIAENVTERYDRIEWGHVNSDGEVLWMGAL